MKRNVYEKIFSLLMIAFMITMLVACASNTNTGNTGSTSANDTINENQQSSSDNNKFETNGITTDNPENKTHIEYVKTYTVYAEQGAVVTWFDSKTGQFRYKDKCETCGQVAGGEHGSLFVGGGSSYNAGFTCKNSNCSMWGKSQKTIIGCSVSGEWVEVYD